MCLWSNENSITQTAPDGSDAWNSNFSVDPEYKHNSINLQSLSLFDRPQIRMRFNTFYRYYISRRLARNLCQLKTSRFHATEIHSIRITHGHPIETKSTIWHIYIVFDTQYKIMSWIHPFIFWNQTNCVSISRCHSFWQAPLESLSPVVLALTNWHKQLPNYIQKPSKLL